MGRKIKESMNKDIAPVQRHPDSIAWEKWKNSPEGRSACCHYTLPSNGEESYKYLVNRLQRAFEAGIKYAEGKKL